MLIDASTIPQQFSLARTKDSVDATEVQRHLETVVRRVEEGNARHAALQENTRVLTEDLQQARDRIAVLEAVPTPTQQQVDTIKLAEKLHARIVSEAHAEAEQIVAAARQDAEELMGQARIDAKKTLEELEDQQNTLLRRIEKLGQFEQDHWSRMHVFISGQLENLGTKKPELFSAEDESE